MNAWQLTLLSFCVLWAQSLVISLVALNSLRERLRSCWKAMLDLERLRASLLIERGCPMSAVSSDRLEKVCAKLHTIVFPESPDAPKWLRGVREDLALVSPEVDCFLRAEQSRLALPFRVPVLSSRIECARVETAEAFSAYEKRRILSTRWVGGPLIAWMGYIPHSAVGISPNPR